MDYELKKAKHEKTSIIPIEEVYTDLDIKENDPYEPSVGYRFDTPRRWSQDKSRSKSIGIRDLKLTPSSGDIRCRFLTYVHIGYTTRHYVWDTDHYEKQGNDTFREINVGPQNNQHPIKFWAISNAISYSITPDNNFEEILTDMMAQINDATWKGVEISANNYQTSTVNNANRQYRGPFYVKEKTTINEEEEVTELSNIGYIQNYNCLKLPLTFYYHYDSNTCEFEMKKPTNLRTIKMVNHSKPTSEPDNYYFSWDNTDIPAAYRTYSTRTIEANKRTQRMDDNDDPIAQLDAYNPTPEIRGVELLMIIDGADVDSLKAVYNFFNQNLSDDFIDDIALVEVDGKDYYVPFIRNIGVLNHPRFIDSKNQPFTSNFAHYSTNDYNTFHLRENVIGMVTNLNLSNVWDRTHLIYHATFAETRTRMIGRNNDHWDAPNKRFIVPGGDQDEFYLRFTTDGKHNILPVGCHFNVDLCFMLNTTNNTATGTGNHDSFK